MSSLNEMQCEPCRVGAPTVDEKEAALYAAQVPLWETVTEDGIPRLRRSFTFPDFKSALAFTNRVGEAAEEEGHHPEVVTAWGRVTVSWWTHKIRGLHRNDFILAARTDRLYQSAG